ncbi:MAG: AAA family ATPase [Roseococcus sp.]|nr:AAA family ATPase [Roseococcus sp.]
MTMRGQPVPDAELRIGSLLFADIVDSTALVGRHDAETAHDLISTALEIAGQCVARFGGRVNRITGDGVMAMFGAPDGLADHALAACAAALDLQARLGAIPGAVSLRVGVHSGEFLLHALHAAGLAALDATGAAVHLAARLQQAAGPGEALISGATLAAAGHAITAEPLGPLTLRGFPEAQQALRLRGADLSLSRFDARDGIEPGFVGRAAERALLAESLARAAAGEGHALLVLGEAGMGKSRLAREAAAEAPSGMRSLAGHALRWRREAALHPIADLIGRTRRPAEAPPALAALLGEDPQDPAWRALQPSERRARSIAAASDWLLASAAEAPAVIILDDLQWADDATRLALEAVLPRLAGQPILLLLLARPEHALGLACRALPTIHLAPMAGAEAASLAEARGAAPGQASAIAARCGGNPFLIEQAAALGDSLPPQARALLVERVDRLPAEAREVLRMLAVVEEPVTPEVLLACLTPEMRPDAIQRHLDALAEAGFLAREGLGSSTRLAPRHALLQEVVYRGLTRRRRLAHHARIFQGARPLVEPEAPMLARHAWLGGLWAEALDRNEAAARRALARFANREAVTLLDRALDALSQLPEEPALLERGIELRLLLRDPLFRLGEGERLALRLREAEALAGRMAKQARLPELRVVQAHHAWMTGDLAEAERVLDLLEAEGRARDDAALLLRCRFQRGMVALSRRHHAEAAAAMAEVAADAAHPRHGGRYGLDAPLVVVALGYQARELADLGDLPAARAAADACIKAAEAVGRPFSWVFAVLADGHVMHRAGEPARAVARLSEALPHCEKAESDMMRVVVLMLLGDAELSLGDHAAARVHLEESVRLAEAMRFMALQDVRQALLARAG